MSDEQTTKQDLIEWEVFLSNSDNKKAAAEMAYQIDQELSGRWFSVNDLLEVFQVSQQEIAKRLEVLIRFNMCVGQVKSKIPMFKIDLDHKVQRELLIESIKEKEGELLFLKEKLSKLD